MNNHRYMALFYALSLLFVYNLAYSCASDLSTTLKFTKGLTRREAYLTIDDAFAHVDDKDTRPKNIVRANITDFSILSMSLMYRIEIADRFYTNLNSDNLIEKVLNGHPTMNQAAIPILKQFFKQFSSFERIERGIRRQEMLTFQKFLHAKLADGKTAFEKIDAELDSVLAYEDDGFPELPTACSSARAAQEFPFLGGLNLMCCAASDKPVTLRFVKHADNLEAHLIIGKTKIKSNFIVLDANAVLARIVFHITEPLPAALDIIDIAGKQYMAANEDPEILIQKVVRLHPDMNQDAMPILRQFFKKFNSLEHIENGIGWKKAEKNLTYTTCSNTPADKRQQPTQP